MRSLSQQISRLIRRPPLPPRVFSNTNFERISPDRKIEEETFSDYLAARYYPIRIGDVFGSRYQVIGKLGYGVFSTVWLALDLNQHRHVALKVFIRSQAIGAKADHELNIYKHIAKVSSTSNHDGRGAIRILLDSFTITGPDGEHHCLVHPPLWNSVQTFMAGNGTGCLHAPALAFVLHKLFLALDFMHNECHLIHTDIKADNIMFGVADNSLFEEFEREELKNPSSRKEVDGRIIYVSRKLNTPDKYIGAPVLCDFGSAVFDKEENTKLVQPDAYRAPEVILRSPWDCKIDIWNAGCMLWNIFEGQHLFSGNDPEHNVYRSQAHLASIIKLLGPPPPGLIKRGTASAEFFTSEGNSKAGAELPLPSSLDEIEARYQGQDKEHFLKFVRKMIQWTPEDRSTANELLHDSWLNSKL